jgi:hypothetical protein
MKSIDSEIFEVEQRLAMRKATLGRLSGETRTRTMKALVSPVTVGGALVLGFVAASFLGRRKRRAEPVVSQETKEQGKGFALGTLLMTGATWFIRSQFGGPVGLAQFVLSKVRRREAATGTPAAFPPSVPR